MEKIYIVQCYIGLEPSIRIYSGENKDIAEQKAKLDSRDINGQCDLFEVEGERIKIFSRGKEGL